MKLTVLKNWETLSSEVVYDAKQWFKVVMDKVKLPSSRIVDDYYRIEAPEYILIYAKAADGKILVETQYKHGLGKITITLPAGYIDKGEAPLQAAQRELFEETGYQAKLWRNMGTYVLDGTRGCGKAHYFVAEDLERVAEPVICDMEELDISFLSTDELFKCIARGDICLLPCISIIAMATNPMFENLSAIVES